VWDYRVITIPLQLRRLVTSTDDGSWDRLCQEMDEIIHAQLQRVTSEDWEPDGPVDFHSLFLRGQVEYRNHPWDPRTFRPRTSVRSYSAVKVPLKRSQGMPLNPPST
jgi:hypothetical protein